MPTLTHDLEQPCAPAYKEMRMLASARTVPEEEAALSMLAPVTPAVRALAQKRQAKLIPQPPANALILSREDARDVGNYEHAKAHKRSGRAKHCGLREPRAASLRGGSEEVTGSCTDHEGNRSAAGERGNMSNLIKRLQRLEEVSRKQELERWVRSLTDAEVLAFIEAQYQRLVSVGWTEEEIFQVFPSLRDQRFTQVEVGEKRHET